MSILLSVILSTAAITAMLALRIIVVRAVLRARVKAGGSCASLPCFGGCGAQESTTGAESVAARPNTTRRIPDAT